jgi:hypothetical protein
MMPPERWLVAAWPGMGNVAVTAAVYLLAKLEMHQVGEFTARDLFELESVDIDRGLLHAAKLPRSRLFLWRNPAGSPDIVLFLGEAQPPTGKLALCQRLVAEGRKLGVSRFFTFSSMVLDIPPSARSRTLAVASDALSLGELQRHEVAVLAEGRIGGLNGVALAAAAEAGLPAVGLLGEVPAFAPQLPYPSAAAAVLRVFKELAGLPLDLGELEEYGRVMQAQLALLYDRIQEAMKDSGAAEEGGEAAAQAPPEAPAPASFSEGDAERIERLFIEARADRSKAFDLKRELDRLGAFHRYEDRFLDLFESRP